MRRLLALVFSCVIAIATVWTADAATPTRGGDARAPVAHVLPADAPNVLLIVADDQPPSMFNRTTMPTVFSQLIDQGVRFDRAYVNSSVCCPSRAEMLTGLFEHHTGVGDNGTKLTRPTIVPALHEAGYQTAIAGKYLNSESCSVRRKEFDLWVCQQHGPPSGLTLQNPTLFVDGRWQSYRGWTPQIEADFLARWIRGSATDRPFFAMYTPTTPHLPANDFRYRTLKVPPYSPASLAEDTRTSGKPFYMRRDPFDAATRARNVMRYEKMSRATRGLDESIKTILDSLGSRAENTIVFYISDNGFLLGEHQRVAKPAPYEEASHMPFVVRYPAAVPATSAFASTALVQNVDIPATVMDLAGTAWGADGRSLLPLLTGSRPTVRDAALLSWCRGTVTCKGGRPAGNMVEPQRSVPSYFGAVDDRYKYVEYISTEKELYDLQADPLEMTNQAGKPAYAAVETRMAAILRGLTAEPTPETTIATGRFGAFAGGTATFVYFTQSRLGTYQCRLDKDGTPGSWKACPVQTVTYSGLTRGSYVFNVRGANQFGVQDESPATRAFSVT